MQKTILLVDDEVQLLSLLSDVLIKEGYNVTTARDGEEAIYMARYTKPDLIILDVMMDKMDGYEFMRHHRKDYDTPIIMLTARISDTDKIVGLKLGADDYVTKPFSPKVLVARVEALLRRTTVKEKRSPILRGNGIVMDIDTHEVRVDDEFIDLTRSEFDLLAILMAAPGRVFSRAELLERLQGAVVEGYERSVDVHVKNLRAKIEPSPAEPRYVQTVYGVGYRFNAISEKVS